MKPLNKQKSILLLAFLIIQIFQACHHDKEVTKLESDKQTGISNNKSLKDSLLALRPKTTYQRVNEQMKFYPANGKGEVLNKKELLKLKSQNQTLDLCGMYVDDESFDAKFIGATYYHDSPYISTTINFEFEVDVPGNILSSGNIAYLRLLATASQPIQIITKTPTITLLSTYYDTGLMTDFNKYKITYYVSLPFDSFCDYNKYNVKLELNTDCELIESFSTKWGAQQAFSTELTYQPEYVFAHCAAPWTITFSQIDVISGLDCHYSTLGSCPKYIVEYKHESSSVWTTLTGGLNWEEVKTVSVPLKGNYDYRYKGLLNYYPTDIYAPYSVWETVTVY